MEKLLANENIPYASIKYLRDAGYDVLSIAETSPGMTDQKVMSLAVNEARVIMTFDRDYGELIHRHKVNPPAGIIYLRFRLIDPLQPGKYIAKLLGEKEISLIGNFTVCEIDRVRQHPLSFQ